MLQAIFRTVLIGFVFLLSGCANYHEPLPVKDTLGISKPLSDVLKDECGLFVSMDSKVSSTEDFLNYKLLILGEVEGHMDMAISTLGMNKTHNFLFKEVIFMYVTFGEGCPSKDSPCATEKDTLISANYKKLPREMNTYSDEKTLNKIFKRSFIHSPDYIFLMTKSNAKKFSKRLKELIIK